MQIESLELAVREAVDGNNSILSIGAITSAMLDVLPPLIQKLKLEFPTLIISVKDIDSADAARAIETGDIDLAFARLEGDLGTSIGLCQMTQDHLVVALPNGHPMEKNETIRLGSLSEELFVMFSRRVSPVYFDSIVSACRSSGFSPRILHEVQTVSSQVAFVGCDQGIALVPAALERLAPRNVVFRPLEENVLITTTAMAWSTTRDNPLVTAVVKSLRPS
jgi:DNA-binding transcriptional LysR family regulator